MAARLRQVVATVLASIAPLVLLELGLRAAGWPTQRVRTIGKLVNVDPDAWNAAVGVFRPATTARVLWPPELSYTVHINALGLRGPEIARTPHRGRERVLALGDSMTFGWYLEEDETWPALLEARLRAAGLDVEVVNGGTGGWTIDSETLFLEERALALSPDRVVVAFCANDVKELAGGRSMYEGQKASVGRGKGPLLRALYGSSLYELYLRAQVAWRHALQRWTGELVASPLTSADLPPERREALWTRYAEWLDRMHALLRARGIPLALVYLPDVYKLDRGLPATDEARLRALAEARGIAFVSPLAAFETRPLDALYHLPWDDHLAPAGAALVADAVAARLGPEMRKDAAPARSPEP